MSEPSDSAEIMANIAAARMLSDKPYHHRLVDVPNFMRLFQAQAEARPEQIYLIYRDGEERRAFTYRQMYNRATGVARFMRDRLNLQTGDHISTVAYNHYDTVAICFGAWLAGLVVIPCNIADSDEQILFVQENAGCKAVFVMPDLIQRYEPIRRKMSRCQHFVRIGGEAVSGYTDLTPALTDDQGDFDQFDLANLDTDALIVYTSGTTGLPKGVVLQQYQLLVNAWATSRFQGFTADDRAMIVLPIHHVNGLIVTLLTPLYSGGSAVLNRRFSATSYWKTLAEEKATWGSVVPTLLAYLCEKREDLRGHDLSRLRHLICGAGPLTVERAVRFEETFGVRIIHGYGLSETTAYNCFMPTVLPQAEHRRWMCDHAHPSIGVAIDCNEMTIHDSAGGDTGEGVKGEIVVRGHNVMKGYFNRPDANAEAFRFGWFRTGDEGFYRLDRGRKFFFITGRIKELIIRGGINYSPLEIDEVLNRIPGVKAAVAVAFDNDYYGEEVGAYVVREDSSQLSAAEILSACAAHLPYPMQPKVVVFGQDFPVTATGKYQRARLKPLFKEFRGVHFRNEQLQ